MANQNKVKSFFDGHRRKAKLELYTHLKTKAEENRFKLVLSIPLLGESLVSMPKAVSDVFTVMAKDDSDLNRASLNIFLEGMTCEFFNDDKSRSPVLSSTGVTFKKLALVATGIGEKRTIDLEMFAYVPASLQLHDWVYPQLHGAFFMESVYSQTEMEFTDDEDEDEVGEEEDEDELAAVGSDPRPGRNSAVPLSDSAARKIRAVAKPN